MQYFARKKHCIGGETFVPIVLVVAIVSGAHMGALFAKHRAMSLVKLVGVWFAFWVVCNKKRTLR